MNVAQLFGKPLAEMGPAVAIVEDGNRPRRTSFQELDAMARRMSHRLRADGLRAGNHVLLFAPPSAELYAALLAVWRAGAVATFIDPSAGRTMLTAACALCQPHAFIASPKAHLLRALSPALRGIARKYTIGGRVLGIRWLGEESVAGDDAIATVDADDVALLTFTSGSTGAPKGAQRTHGILRAQLSALTSAFAAGRGERELVALPIVVLLNLANGVETVLPNADLRRPDAINPEHVLHQMRAWSVTRLVAGPAFLEQLAEGPSAATAFATVRTIVTGGGPVFPDLVSRLAHLTPAATIISVYGSTEAEPIAHIAHREVSRSDLLAMTEGAGLLAGRPVRDVRLLLLHPSADPIPAASDAELEALTVPPGEVGEIVVTGRHVVSRYHRGIGESETKVRVGSVIWHRTGDLGRLDDAGRLWLLGRMSAASHDEHGAFYPFAVECAARTVLRVRRVAAVARKGRRLLVVERDAVDVHLRQSVLEALSWACLQEVRQVDRIPMDKRHNSKVDYPALLRRLA